MKSHDAVAKAQKSRLDLLRDLEEAPPSARFDEDTAAAARNCSVALIQRDRWEGKGIPFIKDGRRVHYLKRDILEYLATLRPVQSTSAYDQKKRKPSATEARAMTPREKAAGVGVHAAHKTTSNLIAPEKRRTSRKLPPGALATNPRRVRFSDPSRAYEFEKQAWIARHPDATHTQYESAMRRIADELGFQR